MRYAAIALAAIGPGLGPTSTQGQPIAPRHAAWPLTPAGIGPVRIGMTRSQVARALGVPLEGEEYTPGCIELRPARGWSGTWFMFEDDRLTRISIGRDSRTTTPRGIGVGATEAQVRAAYGSALRSDEHEYQAAPARYLTFWLRPEVRGVRFETDESRRVRTIHAGGASIQYVEGCL